MEEGVAGRLEARPQRVIGFLAGALTAFLMSEPTMKLTLSKEVLIGLMAAGYAGTDILEGIYKSFKVQKTYVRKR